MHKIIEVKEKLLDELETYAGKPKYTADDVEYIKYLSSAVDHICNILDGMEEYSGADGMGMSSRGGSYRGSYARGRGRNAKRDSMGRYSSEGYSRADSDFMADMRELMADAPNDRIRQKMQAIMSEM